MRIGLLLLALLPAVSAHACPTDGLRPIASLTELPKEMLDLLGRHEGPRPRIADIGEKFNPSDIVFPDSGPQRRLVSGALSQDCIALKVEFGGIGHRTESLEFRRTVKGWAKTKGYYDDRPMAPPVAPLPRS